MNRFIRFLFILCISLFMLVACADREENANTNDQVNEENDHEDHHEQTENNENEHNETFLEDEEEKIEGKVIVDEDKSMIILEAETNLLEHTRVEAILDKAYGEVSLGVVSLEWETTEVDRNGNIYLEYPLDEELFDKYHGEHFEFLVEIKSGNNDNLVERYGEYGENFSGPFAYRYSNRFDEGNKLIVPTYFVMGEDQTEYPIETPVRGERPEDYGDTEIRIDAEVADNDHRFLYVKGETNILEGAMLTGEYYSKEDTVFSDGFLSMGYIEPDGTFELPIEYESITQDGYIEIKVRTMHTHRTPTDIIETYGEGFKHLTGDLIEDDGKRQDIVLRIDTEGMDIATPRDSMITEADGELKIEVPEDVLFDFDKSDLKDEAKQTLNDVIEILEALDDGEVVQIYGHTDNEGDPDYNLGLSEDRAAAVEAYLSDRGDISHLSIETKGYGLEKPITSNATEKGRKQNRRVEIVFQDRN